MSSAWRRRSEWQRQRPQVSDLDCLKYYGDVLGCIAVNETSHMKIGGIEIDLFNHNRSRNITFYLIRENDKKAIYACCNPKPFAHQEWYFDADVLIISLVSDDGILNDGTELKDAPFKDEMWGKTYGYYCELEKRLDGISFAYDGMEIII